MMSLLLTPIPRGRLESSEDSIMKDLFLSTPETFLTMVFDELAGVHMG